MPASRGCIQDIILGGRNLMVVLWRFKLPTEWHLALSIRRITLRPAIFKSNFLSHFWNNIFVIHAFLLASYVTRRLWRLIDLKQWGLGDLPITNDIILSVSLALVQSATVNRSLFFFFPFKRTVANVVFGSRLGRKKKSK